MRMLRDFKALTFQRCTNAYFLHNVSTYHKSTQLSYIVCYSNFLSLSIYLSATYMHYCNIIFKNWSKSIIS